MNALLAIPIILALLTFLLKLWTEWHAANRRKLLSSNFYSVYINLSEVLREAGFRASITFVLALLSTLVGVPWLIYGLLVILAILLGIG